MKQKLKTAWIKALRSGKYRQASDVLERRSNGRITGHCCLGVLCRVAGEKPTGIGLTNSVFDDASGVLSYHLSSKFGLDRGKMADLTRMNDAKVKGRHVNNFKEIATYIQKNVPVTHAA